MDLQTLCIVTGGPLKLTRIVALAMRAIGIIQ